MVKIQVCRGEKEISEEICSATVFTAPYQKKETAEYAVITEEKFDKIRIVFDDDVVLENVVIRPLRYNIEYKTTGSNTVEIYEKQRYNFSVEPNGDLKKAVLIFSVLAEQTDKSNYDEILYFEKGRHFVDTVTIEKNNTLVYLEKGAVLDGRFDVKNAKNIAFDGFGAISYERYGNRCVLLNVENCTQVSIKNIILKESTNWNLRICGCENVSVQNVKIIGYHGNSDGFDICGSRNVLVENCFTRVWDDSLVVKGFDTGDVRNVRFKNCVLWNDFARPMEIGVELRADKVSDVVFEDIDLIHSVTRYPVMGIHHGDRAEISNITFKNINIEHTPGAQLFDIRTIPSAWNKDEKIGKICGVIFENINVLCPGTPVLAPYHSRISGYSKESGISDVVFKNIKFGGKTAKNTEDLGLQIFENVSNVRVLADDLPCLERIETKIKVKEYKAKNTDGGYGVTVEAKLANRSNSIKKGECRLCVSPNRTKNPDDVIKYELNPFEEKSFEKNFLLLPGKYAFSFETADLETEGTVEFLDLPLLLKKDFKDCPNFYFCDSFGNGYPYEICFAVEKDVLKIKSELLKKFDIIIYAAECPKNVETGDMLFSTEESNFGGAPAILFGKNGELNEGPQIGCPEEIAFVFKNYPKVEINSLKLQKKSGGVGYIPLSQLKLGGKNEFLLEAVLCDKSEKRYDFSLFSSPIPKETIREPRVMAHMFVKAIKNN